MIVSVSVRQDVIITSLQVRGFSGNPTAVVIQEKSSKFYKISSVLTKITCMFKQEHPENANSAKAVAFVALW